MIYNKATSQPIIPWRSDKGDKPTKGIHNGSLLIEVDTATTYIFDAENKVWYPFGGKGSGGGGGSSVAVESLTVTENGTYTAPTSKAYSPVTVAVPNPNSVVTVTGTVAKPFGSIDPAELHTAITSNNASVKLVVDASQIGFDDPIRLVGNNASGGNIYFEVIGTMDPTNGIKAAVVAYDFAGALYSAFMAENSVITSLMQYASLLTTTLTVIYHPLPTD